jgi:hypothetical protein
MKLLRAEDRPERCRTEVRQVPPPQTQVPVVNGRIPERERPVDPKQPVRLI